MFEFLIFIYVLVIVGCLGMSVYAMWTNRKELAKEDWPAAFMIAGFLFLTLALWPLWLFFGLLYEIRRSTED